MNSSRRTVIALVGSQKLRFSGDLFG